MSTETQTQETQTDLQRVLIDLDKDDAVRLELQQKHLDEMRELAAAISAEEGKIENLKETLKECKEYLKNLQTQLLKLARIGVSDQLTMELYDAPVQPEHCEEVGDPDWWSHPTAELPGLTEKEQEKVAEHFKTCGELCKWLGDDFAKKIHGFGEKFREKLIRAVDTLAGVPEIFEGSEQAPATEKEPVRKQESVQGSHLEVERDPVEVQIFLDGIDQLLDREEYDEATETLEGIRDWVEENKCYTLKQYQAVMNIHSGFSAEG